MKLSSYAKKLGICYKTAWNHFKAGEIPGAYQLVSGTIIVPEDISQDLYDQWFSKSKVDQELRNDS
jgi:predicted site-specific integrase-resolvase